LEDAPLTDDEMLVNAVVKVIITSDQYKLITGKDYTTA
jgi:hypothetical protein